ncbi:DUF3575 domain-containing protein [Hymenobacter edaphi]|uniref:DUF3575 domain-containing protein n=1 Tax=Hymenobacter edaphi TaxID=2211146 RepID=A0A328BJS8_9BACT|nr:DUF3575 domain-containing protein [Hymenobacter edaphi]RAK66915.1 hypothetical protein DLM85_11965 [Hymenobacter edaphi]
MARLLSALLLLPGLALAQAAPPSILQPRIILKLTPLALLDPGTPTLLLGAEYRLRPRLGVALDYGHSVRQPYPIRYRTDWRCHKLRAELRSYFAETAGRAGFWAVEAAYLPQRYTLRHYEQAAYVHYFDPARVRRDVWALAAHAGWLWGLGPRWRLELAGGLGVRRRSVRYAVRNETVASRGSAYEGLFTSDETPGTTAWLPQLAVRFKVGYALGAAPRR